MWGDIEPVWRQVLTAGLRFLPPTAILQLLVMLQMFSKLNGRFSPEQLVRELKSIPSYPGFCNCLLVLFGPKVL